MNASIQPPSIEFKTLNVPGRKIVVGASDNVIYSFSLTPIRTSALFIQITFPMGGSFWNYELDDDKPFQLYCNRINSFEGSNPVGYVVFEVSNGEDLRIGYIGEVIPKGETRYFFLAVNIGYFTNSGTTIKVEEFDMANVLFSSGTAIGEGHEGSLFEFRVPTARITYPKVAASSLAPASKNNILFRLNVTPEISDMKLTYLTLSTDGSFVTTDIEEVNGFKLYYNFKNAIEASVVISAVNAVNSGEKLEFEIDNLPLKKGVEGYFFVTADISSCAQEDNTIQINMSSRNKIEFVAGIGVDHGGKHGESFKIGAATGVITR